MERQSVRRNLDVFFAQCGIFVLAFQEGRQEELPVKTKKTKMKIIPVASFAIRNSEGEWLLRQRPAKGLLASLWEFPMVERVDGKTPQMAREHFGIELKDVVDILSFKHIFSHLTWEMQSFGALIEKVDTVPEGYRFFTHEEVEALPKPVPVLKFRIKLKQGGKNDG